MDTNISDMTFSLNKEGLDPMIASYAGSQSIFSITRWRKIKSLEKVLEIAQGGHKKVKVVG